MNVGVLTILEDKVEKLWLMWALIQYKIMGRFGSVHGPKMKLISSK